MGVELVRSNLTDIEKIIGEVVGARVIEMAYTGNVADLRLLGINNIGFKRIVEAIPTNINFAVAKSVRFKIDESIFLQTLKYTKEKNKKDNLLNNWIRAGASFEMCRNFFPQHTNRKHTCARAFFGIDHLIKPKNARLNNKQKEEFNKYLWNIEQTNSNNPPRRINAMDIAKYVTNKELDINSLWFAYKEYLEDKELVV